MKPMHNNHMRRNNRHRNGGGNRGGSSNNGGFRPYNRNQMFDSNGPDGRTRGTAQQVYEKYLQQARDASASGDPVRAESLLQHAEHYFRILSSFNEGREPQGQPPQRFDQYGDEEMGDGDEPQPGVNSAAFAPQPSAPQAYPAPFGVYAENNAQQAGQNSDGGMRQRWQRPQQQNLGSAPAEIAPQSFAPRQDGQQQRQRWQPRPPMPAGPPTTAENLADDVIDDGLPAFLMGTPNATPMSVALGEGPPQSEASVEPDDLPDGAESISSDKPKRRGRPAKAKE